MTAVVPAPLTDHRIEIPQEALDDLRERLLRTRFLDDLPLPEGAVQTGPFPPEFALGVPGSLVRTLVAQWLETDWRATEARVNAWPNLVTEVDGQRIHTIHARSARPDATPLILIHGWPNSVLEYVDLLGELTDPADADAPAFHVVLPSLPGFGFSGPTTERGWNRYRIADALAELMRRLGYERYLVAGNDVGSIVGPELGRRHPDAVRGVHVTQIFSFPSGDPAEFEKLTPADFEYLEFLQKWNAEESGFSTLQSTKPHHLAHALLDSPAGQLGWSAQLLAGAGAQHLIENAALYWLTGTGASSTRIYFEDAHAEHPSEPTTVPMGLSSFANDVRPLRPLAERDHANIVTWQMHESGSHWATQDAPDLLLADLRAFTTLLDGS
jgi:pimeloyl-ACP methyl ester carboxylesterase